MKIPQGVLTAVTGVAGSGKSSLVNGVLPQFYPEAVFIDQGRFAAQALNPATYTGMMDTIRSLFAQANRVSASLFSFNSEGPARNAKGSGKPISTWPSWIR